MRAAAVRPRCSFISVPRLRPEHLCSLRRYNSNISKPKTIFSGIQPTGVPHVGNYLGALQQWVKLQNDAATGDRLFFSVVDLHAITIHQTAEQLRESRKQTYAMLLAIGLDPKRSTIFFQSEVPQHSELMWILTTNAAMGYLSRMTQWKDKLKMQPNADPMAGSAKAALKLGLLAYPILQAADILVHRASHVPVGEDQSQHLEFSRECAEVFNRLYGATLIPPGTMISPAKRIANLAKPETKMSKSHPNPHGRINLTDTAEQIQHKLRIAVTDSVPGITYDPKNRPGVANLLDLAAYMSETNSSAGSAVTPDKVARDLEGHSLKALKEHVAKVVDGRIAPIRERYAEIMARGAREVDDAAAEGARRARESAEETMVLVRRARGLA